MPRSSLQQRVLVMLAAFGVGLLPSWQGRLTCGRPCLADAGGQKVAAEAAFARGRQLMQAGLWAEACEQFASSHALDPALGTLLNLAACNEKLGKTATAWSQFREASDGAAQARDERRRREAARRAAALQPQLPRVRFVFPEDARALGVRLDESPLTEVVARSGLPTDPGRHEAEVSKPGHLPWRRAFEAAPAQEVVLHVPPLEPQPQPAAPLAAPAPPPVQEPAPAQAPAGRAPANRTAFFVAAGTTVAAAGLGTFFGLRAGARWDRVSPACRQTGECADEERVAAADAQRAGQVATFSFVAAGVGAAAAAFLWFRQTPAVAETTTLAGWLSDGGAGAVVNGRF